MRYLCHWFNSNKCYELLTLMFTVCTNLQKHITNAHIPTRTHAYLCIQIHRTSHIADKKGHSNQQLHIAFKKFTFLFLAIKLNRPSKWERTLHSIHIIRYNGEAFVCLWICEFVSNVILWILFNHCLMLSMSCSAYKSQHFEIILR